MAGNHQGEVCNNHARAKNKKLTMQREIERAGGLLAISKRMDRAAAVIKALAKAGTSPATALEVLPKLNPLFKGGWFGSLFDAMGEVGDLPADERAEIVQAIKERHDEKMAQVVATAIEEGRATVTTMPKPDVSVAGWPEAEEPQRESESRDPGPLALTGAGVRTIQEAVQEERKPATTDEVADPEAAPEPLPEGAAGAGLESATPEGTGSEPPAEPDGRAGQKKKGSRSLAYAVGKRFEISAGVFGTVVDDKRMKREGRRNRWLGVRPDTGVGLDQGGNHYYKAVDCVEGEDGVVRPRAWPEPPQPPAPPPEDFRPAVYVPDGLEDEPPSPDDFRPAVPGPADAEPGAAENNDAGGGGEVDAKAHIRKGAAASPTGAPTEAAPVTSPAELKSPTEVADVNQDQIAQPAQPPNSKIPPSEESYHVKKRVPRDIVDFPVIRERDGFIEEVFSNKSGPRSSAKR